MARAFGYAAIDVGTTKICTLVGQVGSGGEIEVTGVGIAPSRGLLKGMVVNIDEAAEAIRISVERAERSSARRITSAYVGITGSHLSCQNSRAMVTISRTDHLVSLEDVTRVLHEARSVSMPSNREILHVIPRSYILDGQEGVQNPVGLHGSRLDVEAHVVTGAVTSIQNLTKCVQQAGVEVENLVLEPLASSEAVLSEDERETGSVLVDIGGGTTDLAVFVQGSIGHTAVLPVGGHQFTQDLVIGIRAPYAAAEEAKLAYGSAEPGAIPPDEVVEIAAFGEGSKRPISRRLMSEILRARLDEVLDLTLHEIRVSGYHDLLPAGVIFTGGGAGLKGLTTVAEQALFMPVRIGVPEGVHGLVDTISSPAYAASVGLLLWAVRYGEEDDHAGTPSTALFDFFRNLLSWLKVKV